MTQKKKVQKKSNGTIRVYHSSYDYTEYSSFVHYQGSHDYSPHDLIHEVGHFDGFGDGDSGGGGATGSWGHGGDTNDSNSGGDSGGDSGGGDGGGGGGD